MISHVDIIMLHANIIMFLKIIQERIHPFLSLMHMKL